MAAAVPSGTRGLFSLPGHDPLPTPLMAIAKSKRRTPPFLFYLNIFRSPLTTLIVPSDAFAAPHENRGALRRRQRFAAGANHSPPPPPPAAAAKDNGIMWDPVSQTYAGGAVPSHGSALDLDELLAANSGRLKIFGYGSLCWNPGADGVLSRASLPEDNGRRGTGVAGDANRSGRQVTTAPGRVLGYQRCWCQRSADHRGTPDFNGIVCTLLSDAEVGQLCPGAERPSTTEGLIYTVGEELVGECLAELDFREKGGYARDVIDVVEDSTGQTVKALLYRGTPDNPAFWRRTLLDPPLAAAVISVAVGPSGPNDSYLFRLESFLDHATRPAQSTGAGAGDVRTGELAEMVRGFQTEARPYFLCGSGSNEHGQLLLGRSIKLSGARYQGASGGGEREGDTNARERMDEVRELTEMLLVVPRQGRKDSSEDFLNEESAAGHVARHDPRFLYAGGGHSALLTRGGDFYLWGWNNVGQLGRAPFPGGLPSSSDPVPPLAGIRVARAALGHTHTLVIEADTERVFGFGDDGRGQVSGGGDGDVARGPSHVPRTPVELSHERCVDVAAGLFHSAAVTRGGELVTWGCGRFGQRLVTSRGASTVGRWRPDDGSKLVRAACGRRHTVALDEHGRVWTLGDNKYGQLGRTAGAGVTASHVEPQLVEGPLGRVDSGCFDIRSGWSHVLAVVRDGRTDEVTLFGWGRNDKGQLGTGTSPRGYVSVPRVLRPSTGARGDNDGRAVSILSARCGAECSHVLDAGGTIHSTGWNEHGNLGVSGEGGVYDECCSSWTVTAGARVTAPSHGGAQAVEKIFAVGGAHMVVMAT